MPPPPMKRFAVQFPHAGYDIYYVEARDVTGAYQKAIEESGTREPDESQHDVDMSFSGCTIDEKET